MAVRTPLNTYCRGTSPAHIPVRALLQWFGLSLTELKFQLVKLSVDWRIEHVLCDAHDDAAREVHQIAAPSVHVDASLTHVTLMSTAHVRKLICKKLQNLSVLLQMISCVPLFPTKILTHLLSLPLTPLTSSRGRQARPDVRVQPVQVAQEVPQRSRHRPQLPLVARENEREVRAAQVSLELGRVRACAEKRYTSAFAYSWVRGTTGSKSCAGAQS